jgi:peptidoglycan-associated lipoprotein
MIRSNDARTLSADALGRRGLCRRLRRKVRSGATCARAHPGSGAGAADSAERDRLEKERMAREAAEKNRTVAADLAAMINFDYDQAQVRSADQATLDRKAAILIANPGVKLRIAGHADERGSDEYNLALGNRRAAAAKRYLENKGVDASRLDVISYGEERPLNPGSDETAYAQNRRDEFEVTAGANNLTAP